MFFLCQKYAPLGVEVLAPSEVKLDAHSAQGILIDAAGNTQAYAKYIYENILQPVYNLGG